MPTMAAGSRRWRRNGLEFVMQLAKRIIVLDHGKLIADGCPTEIMNNEHVLDAYFGKRISYA
jgi:ABC-type branched-subunit amino acid transport system ATPase component